MRAPSWALSGRVAALGGLLELHAEPFTLREMAPFPERCEQSSAGLGVRDAIGRLHCCSGLGSGSPRGPGSFFWAAVGLGQE